MTTQQITGTIVKVEISEREPFEGQSRYLPNTVTTEKHLKVVIESNNIRYYFNTPSCRMNVTTAPGMAIVSYYIENGSSQWMKEIEGNNIATRDAKNTNKLESLVDVGDTVEISGRLQMKTSKYGNEYGTLTHVKRLN